jgi:hypothetical protein
MIFDCHRRKKPRTTASNPALPAIHVHNHLPGSGARFDTYPNGRENTPPDQSTPLPTTVKRERSTPFKQSSSPRLTIDLTKSNSVIDLTNSSSDDEDLGGICYPRIHDMLAELDSELPELGILQYEHILAEDGFLHVNQLVDNATENHLRNELLIPFGVVIQLRHRAERLMRRTQKLKREE